MSTHLRRLAFVTDTIAHLNVRIRELEQARDLRKKLLTENHPAYATSLSNLAVVYCYMGDYARAEPLLRQGLEISRSNLELASAAQSEAARTEPPFRLQGSYRDMNKIAQRLRPVMNDAEREAVVDDHYTAEAQTLATGAEASLLKLAELRGTLDAGRAARWSEVKTAHVRARTLGGSEDDPLTRAVAALGLLADRVAAVESAIDRARAGGAER